MYPNTNAALVTCLKSNNTINIISDADVVRITYESITKFVSLTDFDKKIIESLPTTCKEKIPAITDDPSAGITSETAIPGVNISLVAICRLVVVVKASKYYTSIGSTMDITNIHYGNLVLSFKIEWDAYEELNKEDYPNVPLINDKDNYHEVNKWVYTFTGCLRGSRGPLVYVI